MKYLKLETFRIHNYTNNTKSNEIIIFKDDLTPEQLSNYITIVNRILDKLEEDKITWCRGIVLDGKSYLKESVGVYNVVSQIEEWNVVYVNNHINPDDINKDIKNNANLYLQV